MLSADEIIQIKEICGVDFADAALLERIFTHSSYGKQNGVPHNETLATLGDAVLKLVFSLIIAERYPDISKGDLTECKKILEADEVFAGLEIVEKLLPFLRRITDKTKVDGDGVEIKAQFYEALCYGIFVGGGLDAVKTFVTKTQTQDMDFCFRLYEKAGDLVRKFNETAAHLEDYAEARKRFEDCLKPRTIPRARGEKHIYQPTILLEDPFCKEPTVTQNSTDEDKIMLFMSLFHGRSDVYAKRYESSKTGKKGYNPACRNEWGSGCDKKKVKCADCKSRDLLPLDAIVIKSHLQGKVTVGIFPLLENDECYFLAIDFDGENYKKDVGAFREACEALNLSVAVERSRSGDGAHVWFFFEDKVPTKTARKMGVKLLTYAMNLRHEIAFKSYDRLFPNQDSMPKGGFGNLIALPLQGVPRRDGNSVFVDGNFTPYADQWAYLSAVPKMDLADINRIIDAIPDDETDKDTEPDAKPWDARKEKKLSVSDFPESVNIVLADMLYIEKKGMSERLLCKLKRLAAFKNPEFFKAQAMRLNTHNKPRIISCADESKEYIHLPRGLLDEAKRLLSPCKIIVEDKRNTGTPIDIEFIGTLRDNQGEAVADMLKYDNGVLSATTAFGKTVAGINLIAQRKTNTLILVHRTQLAAQWQERLEQFLKIHSQTLVTEGIATKRKSKKQVSAIGLYGASKSNLTNIIDIALLQSVAGKDGEDVKNFIKNYGMVIVDECHHISAVSFEQVLKAVNAKYVYGLTATPKRQDGHDPIITMQCGAIRYVADNKSEQKNRNFEHFVIPRFTRFTCEDEAPITKIYAGLATNSFRNEMIITDAVVAFKKGRTPIILCNRKDHVATLAETLTPHCKNIIVLVGGGGAKEKREELARLKALSPMEPFIIVATGKYVGEGFDEPRLDTLFLADPISWRGTLEQYVGRLHRNYDGKKEVIVYDYADIHSKVLEKMYQSRVKGYAALGYTVRAVANGGKDIIFSEYDFEDAFNNDIASAVKSIVISSPYLREKSVKDFVRNVEFLQDVSITICTKEPDEKSKAKAMRPIKMLEDAGIKVVIMPKLYQKFAVIDGATVWYGGVNLIGAGYSDESVMRIPSREVATELLRTISAE